MQRKKINSEKHEKVVEEKTLNINDIAGKTGSGQVMQAEETRINSFGLPTSDDEASEDEIEEAEPDMDESKLILPNHLSDAGLSSVDPETQARLEALLEAADPDVLRRLTSSVSSALDEAAAALTRMRAEQQHQMTPQDTKILNTLVSLGTRTLAEACNDGDTATVRKLLDEGRSVNEMTEEGESLLSLACSAGYFELAQVLLAMRANVEDRGIKNDCTPLMEAASGGHEDIVKLLINAEADVNAQSAAGNTPLHYAACGGFDSVVRVLIEHGANVEEHNENGHTPLMEAASAGHVSVAAILLQAGAGINTHSNEFKESALTLACYKGHLKMVKFLLEAGADQEHKTDEMHTALMEASMDGHVEVARLLLDSGAQVNMPADSFESPLTLAACGGHVELANLLIERGANLEEVNDEGYTPLMEAAREGHEEMVALLLAHGADINAQTEETQETALTLACCGGFLEVADFLIKSGADVELGCSTPLMEAAQEGHIDLVKYLLTCGPETADGNIKVSNVHAETSTGDTALTYACENGHTDVADLLLQAGAELEHESEGGRTPLMKAARAGHLCTVQFLIGKGADVNRKTSTNDHTVLSLACAGGHLAVVELLLRHGGDPTHKLKDGSTMLIEGSKGGHTAVVNMLLDFPTSVLTSSGEQVTLSPPQVSSGTLEQPRVPTMGLNNVVPPPDPASATQMPLAFNQLQLQQQGLNQQVVVPSIPVSLYTPNVPAVTTATAASAPLPLAATVPPSSTRETKDAKEAKPVRVTAAAARGGNGGRKRVTNNNSNAAKNVNASVADAGAPPDLTAATVTSSTAESTRSKKNVDASEVGGVEASGGSSETEAADPRTSRKGDNLKNAKEEQIQKKQQIIEELQKVEQELQSKAQQQLLSSHKHHSAVNQLLSTSAAETDAVADQLQAHMAQQQGVNSGTQQLQVIDPCTLDAQSVAALQALNQSPQQIANLQALLQQGGALQVPAEQYEELKKRAIPLHQALAQLSLYPNNNTARLPVALPVEAEAASSKTSASQPTCDVTEALADTNAAASVDVGSGQATKQNEFSDDDIDDDDENVELQPIDIAELDAIPLPPSPAPILQPAFPLPPPPAADPDDDVMPAVGAPDGLAEELHGSSEELNLERAQIIGEGTLVPQNTPVNASPLAFALDATQQLAFPTSSQQQQFTQLTQTVIVQDSAGNQQAVPIQQVIPFQMIENVTQQAAALTLDQQHVLLQQQREQLQAQLALQQQLQQELQQQLRLQQEHQQLQQQLKAQLEFQKQQKNKNLSAHQAQLTLQAQQQLQAALIASQQQQMQLQPDLQTQLQLHQVQQSLQQQLSQVQQLQSSQQLTQQELIQHAQQLQQQLQQAQLLQQAAQQTSKQQQQQHQLSEELLQQAQQLQTLQQTQQATLQHQAMQVQQLQQNTQQLQSQQLQLQQSADTQAQLVSGQPLLYQNSDSSSDTATTSASTAGGAKATKKKKKHLHSSNVSTSASDLQLQQPLSLSTAAASQIIQQQTTQVPASNTVFNINNVAVANSLIANNISNQLAGNIVCPNQQQLANVSNVNQFLNTNVINVANNQIVNYQQAAVTLETITPPPSIPLTPNPSPASPDQFPQIDVDAETESNHDTALTLACAGGHAELVSVLLSRGSDIEHRDKKGFTPLILAATAGHVEVVEILLDHQAEIEAQSERTKDTPLSLACSGGRYEVVELLLQRGANKEHRNVSDYTPLSLAASGGYVNIIKLLLSHGAEINSRTGSKLGISPLMLAAMNGHTAAVKLLLDMGSDINAQIETNRNTALTLACFQGRHEVVSLLVDRKANIEHRAKTGLTPLMEAASGGYVEVGRVLLDKNADVNAPPVPSSRDTALTIAADKGHYRFVELLLSRQASVDVKNKKGNSPLWLACNGGHLDVVQLLVNAKADVDSQDNRKVSCLMSAFRKGHTKVVKWLVKHVTQFPSDSECMRFIATITDKELLKKCHQCMEIIVSAKDRQAAEANKYASILLEEIDAEKSREDAKKAAAARKREKKRKKKKEKAEREQAQQEEAAEKQDGKQSSPEPDQDEKQDEEDEAPEETDSVDKDSTDEPMEQLEQAVKTVIAAEPLKRSSQATPSSRPSSNAQPVLSDTSSRTSSSVESDQQMPAPAQPVSTVTTGNRKSRRGKARGETREAAREARNNNNNIEDTAAAQASPRTPAVHDVHQAAPPTRSARTPGSASKRSSKRAAAHQESNDDEPEKNVRERGKGKSRLNLIDGFGSSSPMKYGLRSPNVNSPAKKGGKKEEGWKEVTRKESVNRSKKVSVPATAIARVIGRNGCNINAVREVSGAHIEVDKPRGVHDRTICIKGSTEATRLAHSLIAGLIRDPDKDLDQLLPKPKAKQPVVVVSTSSNSIISSSMMWHNSMASGIGITVAAAAPAATASNNSSSSKASVRTVASVNASKSLSAVTNGNNKSARPSSMPAWGMPPVATQPGSPKHQQPKLSLDSSTAMTSSAGRSQSNVARQLFVPDEQQMVLSGAGRKATVTITQTSTRLVTTATSPSVLARAECAPGGPIARQTSAIAAPRLLDGAGSPMPLPIKSHGGSGNASTQPLVYSPFNDNLRLFHKVTNNGKEEDRPDFAKVAAAGVSTTATASPGAGSVSDVMASMEDQSLQAKAPGYKAPGAQRNLSPLNLGADSRAPGYRGNSSTAPLPPRAVPVTQSPLLQAMPPQSMMDMANGGPIFKPRSGGQVPSGGLPATAAQAGMLSPAMLEMEIARALGLTRQSSQQQQMTSQQHMPDVEAARAPGYRGGYQVPPGLASGGSHSSLSPRSTENLSNQNSPHPRLQQHHQQAFVDQDQNKYCTPENPMTLPKIESTLNPNAPKFLSRSNNMADFAAQMRGGAPHLNAVAAAAAAAQMSQNLGPQELAQLTGAAAASAVFSNPRTGPGGPAQPGFGGPTLLPGGAWDARSASGMFNMPPRQYSPNQRPSSTPSAASASIKDDNPANPASAQASPMQHRSSARVPSPDPLQQRIAEEQQLLREKMPRPIGVDRPPKRPTGPMPLLDKATPGGLGLDDWGAQISNVLTSTVLTTTVITATQAGEPDPAQQPLPPPPLVFPVDPAMMDGALDAYQGQTRLLASQGAAPAMFNGGTVPTPPVISSTGYPTSSSASSADNIWPPEVKMADEGGGAASADGAANNMWTTWGNQPPSM